MNWTDKVYEKLAEKYILKNKYISDEIILHINECKINNLSVEDTVKSIYNKFGND